MMVGGAFWGSLSDKYGRRKILLTALTVNLAGGVCCALVQTFWELILCRTICGLGVRSELDLAIFSADQNNDEVRGGRQGGTVAE